MLVAGCWLLVAGSLSSGEAALHKSAQRFYF
jgi:hypothetical protein